MQAAPAAVSARLIAEVIQKTRLGPRLQLRVEPEVGFIRPSGAQREPPASVQHGTRGRA